MDVAGAPKFAAEKSVGQDSYEIWYAWNGERLTPGWMRTGSLCQPPRAASTGSTDSLPKTVPVMPVQAKKISVMPTDGKPSNGPTSERIHENPYYKSKDGTSPAEPHCTKLTWRHARELITTDPTTARYDPTYPPPAWPDRTGA